MTSFPVASPRRRFLAQSACGFGMLALADLMAKNGAIAAEALTSSHASGSAALAPKPPHFPARAKRVIFLFMHGGPSHVDT
ncbi:MAG TPA: hypothetical protein DDZ51_08765, partial [Planctomycetaceae bacterium]|nr:hypothetical protein [Planctomycetaceae bacterium]